MAVPSSLQHRQPERLYFAFGSNLHVSQMAKRCPESRYIGTAELHDYRFQINQRGFANVLPSRGDHVEGLVYLLSLTDEARLDRSEGVPTAYQKCYLAIEVFTAAIDHVGRAVPELAQQLEGPERHTAQLEASTKSIHFRSDSLNDPHLPVYQKETLWTSASKTWRSLARGSRSRDHAANDQAWVDEQNDTHAAFDSSRRLQNQSLRGQATEALVYLSNDFIQDSEPRNEYIDRMNAGIVDARKLGMPELYIDACLRRYIAYRELPNQGFTSAQQRFPETRSHRLRQSDPAGHRLPESNNRSRHGSVTAKPLAPAVEHRERRQPKNLNSDDTRDTEPDPRQREE